NGFHLANRGVGNERYILKPNLPSGSYILSFWYKGDPISIKSTGQPDQQTLANANTKMEYITFEVQVNAGGVLEISSALNAFIDELRLYPVGAQMTTYCYDKALRLHTQTDINNRSTYYHYDAFGRLEYVQDQEGNYVQGYQYNYKN
ncbi:MAG: RHS repeat domain-containing protein, partial [Bacteroidota bacterium]